MKIFGIGLSKTGTSSLASALQMLGFRVKDYPGIEVYRPGDVSSINRDLLEAYDALTDTPIPSFYQALDRAFPGSKFILTVREREGWLRSCQKQFTERLAAKQNEAHNQLFLDLYGTTVFDAEKFSAGYDRFVAGVLDYFHDRPADLLVMDITAGEGWEKLCPFLGRDIPEVPFPKANVTSITWLQTESIVQLIQEAGEVSTRHGLLTRVRDILQCVKFSNAHHGRVSSGAHNGGVLDVIGEALARLQPNIPIMYRGRDPTPYSVRRHWNHFWLLDAGNHDDSHDARSLNIALIQDGGPFLAVSYAPDSQLLCYGRADTKLHIRIQGQNLVDVDSSGITRQDAPAAPVSFLPLGMRACLAMCSGQREWQTDASVHKSQISSAILLADKLGYVGEELFTGERIRFNTPDMMLAGVRFRLVSDRDAT